MTQKNKLKNPYGHATILTSQFWRRVVEMESTDKRQVIMQTAEKLFKSRRIHEITLDEVAQKAKVGKGTIYLYFQNKDDLFFQVATSGFDELCELVRDQVPTDALFEDQVLHMCQAIGAFFEKRREMFQMMMTEDARMHGCQKSLRERWMLHRTKLRDAVGVVLMRGVSAGLVRGDISPEILATMLLAMMRARAHDLGDLSRKNLTRETIIDLFLKGAGKGKTQKHG